jgi:hypothetical protein
MARSLKHKGLQVIPGIGPSMERDLHDLGIQKVEDLKGKSPEKMYEDLMKLRQTYQDRCVLYVFRCAVYYASHTVHDPEKLKWWNWKDTQKPKRRRL